MKKRSFHVKHLYQPLCLLGLAFLIYGCIPLRIAPRISNYEVSRGKDIDKRIKFKEHIFVFENPKRKTQFEKFLENNYKLIPYGYGDRYEVVLNDNTFDVRVSNLILNDSYIDLTGIWNNDDENADDDMDTYHYITIRVSSEYEEDCLSVNSLHYDLVLDYLEKLRTAYLSSL
ncbi:hypothetical protein [Sinomicrobium sp. M5D2P17]